MMGNTQARSGRKRKIAAIAAGLLVVGVGATYTLASWTDSEWVWGGANGDPGIGTSTFSVQQNTTAPYDDATANWVDRPNNPGDEMAFTANALTLSPGTSTFAPVSLRSVTGSVAGTLTLQAAVAAAGTPAPQNDTALWNAVKVGVWTASGSTRPTCDSATVATAVWTNVVPAGTAIGSESAAAQSLAAASSSAPGVPQHYCFQVTLPTGSPATLQGLKISPAWQFIATSS